MIGNRSRLQQRNRQSLHRLSGFTLIELLIVIAIIALLATLIIVRVSSATVQSKDARRLADFKQIQSALDLYYNDHGYYPQVNSAISTSPTGSWASLETALEDYISPRLPKDPDNSTNVLSYRYDADSGDGYQTYGMMMSLQYSGNGHLASDDGGYYDFGNGSYYEIGRQPTLCMEEYSGTGRDWWAGGSGSVCNGGTP